MKKNKLYFSEFSENFCYSIDEIIDMMYNKDEEKITVYEAERESKTDYFFCKHYQEVGEKSDRICGKECGKYFPRNKIKGICKYYGFCYSEGKGYILTIDGKLTPKS